MKLLSNLELGNSGTNEGIINIGNASQIGSPFDMGILLKQASSNITGLQFENTNAAGQARFVALANDGTYIAATIPNTGVSGTWFGLNRSNSAFYWSTSTRNLGIGTLGAGDLVLGTNDTARLTINATTGNIVTTGTLSVPGGNSTQWNTAFGWGDHDGLYSLLGHTHTEADITDLQAYLLPSDIGVTVQGYNANTTVQGVITLSSLGGTTDHTALSNIGTNTHAQIDTHISDSTIHFTQAAISITESQISDLGSYLESVDIADINATGIADATTFLRGDGTWSVPAGGGGGISNIVEDTTPQLGGNLDGTNKNITAINSITASAALFGSSPANLRAFNIRGTGLNGRLSLQGGSGDNPGLEMTTTGNTTRVLLRLAESGVDGTELQCFTENEGGAIAQAWTTGEDATFWMFPEAAGTSPTKNAGIRNNSGTMQFKSSAGSWTNMLQAGGVTQLSDLSDVNTSTVTNRNVLVADGVDFESRALVEADISDLGTYLTDVVQDTTPELGGDLDALGNNIDNIGFLYFAPLINIGRVGSNILMRSQELDIRSTDNSTSNIILNNFAASKKLTLDAASNITGSKTQSFQDASGTIALTSDLSGFLENIVEDTAPTLGGNLDAASFDLNNIGILDFAAGVFIEGASGSFTANANNFVIKTSTLGTPSTFVLSNSDNSQMGIFSCASITGIRTYTLPNSTGTIALTSNLSTFLENVAEDPTPQLGGHLDAQNWNISNVNNLYFENTKLGIEYTSPNLTIFATDTDDGIVLEANKFVSIKAGGLNSASLESSLLSSNRTYSFPDQSGTIALTSDIPAAYVLPARVGFAAKNSNTTIPAATFQRVTFSTEIEDTNSAWNGSVFTVPAGEGGLYEIIGHATFSSVTNGNIAIVGVEVNGSLPNGGLLGRGTSGGTGLSGFGGGIRLSLSAGDEVEMVAYCANATTLYNTGGQLGYSSFSCYKMR